jgi:hypothetical protein
MTFGEFLDYEYGYEYRKAEKWDETRNLMWASLSAMGGNKQQPKDMIPLWIDKLGKKEIEEDYLPDELVKKWVDSL